MSHEYGDYEIIKRMMEDAADRIDPVFEEFKQACRKDTVQEVWGVRD